MQTLCAVEGCTKDRYRRSRYCSTCESRIRIHGDPHYTETPTLGMSVEDRYERLVVRPADPDACWGWNGTTSNGYPITSVKKRHVRLHRWAWERANGRALLPGEHVCHACDNPPCTNPRHLFVGTHLDNQADRDRKGRVRHGDTHPCAVLTAEKVREARERYRSGGVTIAALASEMGVTHTAMGNAVRGVTWKRA